MGQFGAGQGLRRLEDARLLEGQGRYCDDLDLPGAAHAVFVRSTYAHADILSVDTAAASEAPGVFCVFTIEELDADGIADNPCMTPMKGKGGAEVLQPPRPILARRRVRHVGEPVVCIVAESRAAAADAAELVEIDYDELPAVTGTAPARAPDAPQIWDDCPGNLCLDWEQGDREACERAFAQAAHITRLQLVNNRVVVNAMEPRAALAEYDPDAGRYTLHTGTQGPHRLRTWMAEQVLKIPPEKLRILTPDVGGGFGMKIFIYSEQICVLWAAKRLGRPVRWVSDRSEGFVSDSQGRDHVMTAELALDAQGKILALQAASTAAMGAYLSNFGPYIPTACCIKMLTGLYDFPAVYGEVACVFSNTVPVDAYRGAGRPEAAYLVERLIDQAGRETGLGPAEIRRRNFVRAEALPFTNAMGETFDSGNFTAVMEKAMAEADWPNFEQRRQASKAAGKERGIGMACYVEACGGFGNEEARIELGRDGRAKLTVGTQTNGQGHATAYAQILNDKLGLDPDQIDLHQGDSDDGLTAAGGTGGSRSLIMGGSAIAAAADKLIAAARDHAREMLQAQSDQIRFEEGLFSVENSDRQVQLADVARHAAEEGHLLGAGANAPTPSMTYPNGCHICELEVDPESGAVEILKYVVADDFGRVINPLLVSGQVHGGIAQGLGQALLEETVYDPDSGQLLSGSFMDYGMPRADDLAWIGLTLVEDTPCTTNDLGAKGAGEAGAIGACPAAINAIIDALKDRGVTHIDMPATPQRVWRAIKQASG